ncbi:hypothetical protein F5Y13DRAFT_196593 [Hypoxylon sp. FL1857]|nr:hypothetical protein F5Y13DRAFT_196593 [Hypoxylon sp. FL1857]
MVHEHQHPRSTGSLSRKGSKANRNHNSSGSGSSGGVISRVLGSFRQKHREDKNRGSSRSEGDQQDWIANYKGTHRPDRPLVDKRIRTILPDDEYAARIEQMQERNQRYYGLGGQDRRPTPPPIQTSIPNFSYSSTSPKGAKGNSLSPTTAWTEWRHIDSAPSSVVNPTPRSPISPETVTIQLYPESDLDRGRIVRHIARTAPQYLLPRKAYSPDEESAAESSPQGSLHKRKRSSADFPAAADPVHRQLRSPTHDDRNSPPPDLTCDSSPISPSGSRNPLSPLTPVDEHSPRRIASPEPPPPRTCPWPDCNAALLTEREKQDNLCAKCYEALHPRESEFFGPPRERRKPDVEDARLEALKALLGTRVDVAKDVHVDEIHTAAAPTRLVNSRFNMNGFKLQPAPVGRRRRPSLGPRRNDGSKGDITRHGIPSPPRSGDHIGFQDARWYPSPRTTPDINTKPKPKAVEPPSQKELDREDGGSRSRTESPGNSDSSWTTDTRRTESSDDEGAVQHYTLEPEPKPRDKDVGDAATVASRTNNERRGDKGNPDSQPARRGQQRRPRDTVLYKEIEDIIDCYTTTEEVSAEENERRKADAIASYYMMEPEAVEMRRKGFI